MKVIYHVRLLGTIQIEKEGVSIRDFESRKTLALLGKALELPEPLEARGDAGALEQLFLNLLTNAAQAMDPGGAHPQERLQAPQQALHGDLVGRIEARSGGPAESHGAFAHGKSGEAISIDRLELEAGELVVLDVAGFPLRRRWYVSHREGKRLSRAAQLFLQYLQEEGEEEEEPPSGSRGVL